MKIKEQNHKQKISESFYRESVKELKNKLASGGQI